MTDALFLKYADELWNIADCSYDKMYIGEIEEVRLVFNTVLRQAMLLSKEGGK